MNVVKIAIIALFLSLSGYALFSRFPIASDISIDTILPDIHEVETLVLASENEQKMEKEDSATTEKEDVAPGVSISDTPINEGNYETLHRGESDTDESYRPAISPCVTPMSYKIGTFDSRFGLSQEYFLAIAKDAVRTWENSAGTSLFTYDPKNGQLTINLIYDERQATTVNLGYLALEIENTKQTAENIRQAYEIEKESYVKDSEQFNVEASSFQTRYNAYNDKVKSYNERGGATQLEYDAMMAELAQLKKESAAFDSRRDDLVKRMEEINVRVKKYNDLVAYVNTLIRRSNTSGGRTFTEGRFVPSTNTIDIYQYADETKLKRVLIHEFGHALGIGHVENVVSVMYSFNSGTSTSLSSEDIRALREVCN